MKPYHGKILIDCRELVPGRLTGIGRVLEGLIHALAETGFAENLMLAVFSDHSVPSGLKTSEKIVFKKVPGSFLGSEKALSDLSGQDVDLFISPYPKLPLFGCYCRAVHIIHDILDLTHPLYRRRLKAYFDEWRLKRALRRADLTWYDSAWSLEETRRYAGLTGQNPRVRHLGINEGFSGGPAKNQQEILDRYHLEPGYILVVGNGLPHKNLGVLLKISGRLSRRIVFAGVSRRNRGYWASLYPDARATWIAHVAEESLPGIIKGALCLAQPSAIEGYGYPPLEAMACGVPPVVSNIPVLLETTGGNALSVDPENPGAWIQAFEMLEDDEFRKDLVDKGLKWVEPLRGGNGWQRHIQDINDLLRDQ